MKSPKGLAGKSPIKTLLSSIPTMDDPAEDPDTELVQSRELLLAQQLALESKQFERLKHDFKYNLGLLRERDAELEKYDLETAALRTEVERHKARYSKEKAERELKEAEVVEERAKVAALELQISDAAHEKSKVDEKLAKKAAEVTRLQAELDEATSSRSDALARAQKAEAEAAEIRQEAAGVRNELTLRLQQQQQGQAEAEESWRSALADERSQAASRAKTVRAEATRAESVLQEQIDKLQAEAAEMQRSSDAALDELRSLKETSASEAMRSQRQREEHKRVSTSLAESQQRVLALSRAVEQAELMVKTSASDHAASLEREKEEHVRVMASAQRGREEAEASMLRKNEEEVRSLQRQSEMKIAELESQIEREKAKAKQSVDNLAKAEERQRNDAGKVEQLTAEKSTLVRDAGALRSEAISSRERADVLQKMLTQRTEYMRKLQLAATKREEQLSAHFAEKEHQAVSALQEQLNQEGEAKAALQKQLDEMRSLHADAERRAANLQGAVFAMEQATAQQSPHRGAPIRSAQPATASAQQQPQHYGQPAMPNPQPLQGTPRTREGFQTPATQTGPVQVATVQKKKVTIGEQGPPPPPPPELASALSGRAAASSAQCSASALAAAERSPTRIDPRLPRRTMAVWSKTQSPRQRWKSRLQW